MYKRFTKYNEYNHNAEVYAYTVGKEDIYFDGIDIVGNENSSLAQETIDKLALLEDKIENGTLIELPRIVTYVDYCYGLEKYLVQWIDNGKIKSKTFLNEKKALKKLKELQNDTTRNG